MEIQILKSELQNLKTELFSLKFILPDLISKQVRAQLEGRIQSLYVPTPVALLEPSEQATASQATTAFPSVNNIFNNGTSVALSRSENLVVYIEKRIRVLRAVFEVRIKQILDVKLLDYPIYPDIVSISVPRFLI